MMHPGSVNVPRSRSARLGIHLSLHGGRSDQCGVYSILCGEARLPERIGTANVWALVCALRLG